MVKAGLAQLYHRLQRLLINAQDFRNCELEVDGEGDNQELVMDDGQQPVQYVTMYNWNGNKGWMVAEIPPLPVGPDNR